MGVFNIKVGDVFIPLEPTFGIDNHMEYTELVTGNGYRVVNVKKSPVSIEPVITILHDSGIKLNIDMDLIKMVHSKFKIKSQVEYRIDKINSLNDGHN